MSNFFKTTAIFLQARLKSSRMPGKALLKLHGKPIVVHAMERLNVIPADYRVLVSSNEAEAELKPLAIDMGWKFFSGDEQNVLQRFVDAINYYEIEVVIRATADNPLVSSEIANKTLELFSKNKCDYARLEPIPYGSGIEVIKADSLLNALDNTRRPYYLEHVAPYIYEHKDKFRLLIRNFYDKEVERTDVHLSIDTRNDFEKVNYLYRNLGTNVNSFKIKNIIKIWDKLNFNKYKRILFVTAFGGNFGMGHLNRLKKIASHLQENFYIYFSLKSGEKYHLKDFFDFDVNFIEYDNLINYVDREGLFERVIVDVRDTDEEEILLYKELGTVITLDNMGKGSDLSDVTISTLPVIKEDEKRIFNFNGIKYLFTNVTFEGASDEIKEKPEKILVTFGGSDPADLTGQIMKTFEHMEEFLVTIIIGPYFKTKIKEQEHFTIVKNVFDLQPYIKEADIVITSFGITFLESLILKKPVILINPTDYHEKLTRNFNYPYYIKRNNEKHAMDFFSSDIKKIIQKMRDDNIFKNYTNTVLNPFFSLDIGTGVGEIIDFINKMDVTSDICPYCCNTNNRPIKRSKKWNMFVCGKCGLYYITPFYDNKTAYDQEYFLDEYKKTYGKTYEEDKKNITRFAARRVENIKKYLNSGRLLDFGSALGYFAEYCEEHGFETLSIDVSEFAVNYIKRKLKLPAIQAGMEYLEKSDEMFDVITSFYVIEHIKDFEKLIFLFTCHLNQNGVLALSTPNASGVSIKYNFDRYVDKHPDDHYRIFSPRFLKRILKKYGYTDIRIVITGVHIERFIKNKRIIHNTFLSRIICFFAKLLRLGDTFEIYARKK